MRRARVFVAGRDAPEDVSGADVVVVRASSDEELAPTIRDRAPNAIVLVVGGSPQPFCETTLFPRARIIGLDESEVDGVVEAIVNDRTTEFESVVRCEGERGVDGDFVRAPVKIGGRGVVEIVDS